ncbi:hypothetical protein A986_20506 [Pseudomonas fluorescens BRIP34879]|nr:hypothetical protein A986_20506 [Pseudomonas fluorescens BRIP34879]
MQSSGQLGESVMGNFFEYTGALRIKALGAFEISRVGVFNEGETLELHHAGAFGNKLVRRFVNTAKKM